VRDELMAIGRTCWLYRATSCVSNPCRKLALLLQTQVGPCVQAVGASAVGEQLMAVDSAIAALSGERLKQLLLVRCSRQHRARLAHHLQQAASKESKFKQ
jgi:CDK5 regulatory subunit-associated protein 3